MRGQRLVRHAQLRQLDVVVVGDDPAADDVARTRHRRQPRGDEAAGAGLGRRDRQALLPREVEHELLDRPVVLREHGRAERLLQRRRQRLRRAEELGPDLASVRADRRLDPFGLASQLGECPRDCRLAYTVSTQDVPLRSLRRGRARSRTASSSSAARQSRRSSGGGPGRTTTTAPSSRRRARAPCLRSRSRARPREPSPASARLPRTRAYGRLKRSAIRRETALDLLLELRVDREPRAPPPEPGARRCGRRESGPARPRSRAGRPRALRGSPPRARTLRPRRP